MNIEFCQNKIKLVNEKTGTLILYDASQHRENVLNFILSWPREHIENLIWPDMQDTRNKANEIISDLQNDDLVSFCKRPAQDIVSFAWAKLQLQETDLSIPLDKVLDSLIETGKIQFATEDDIKASIVPAPVTEEDFLNLPVEDSRHPLNKVKVEIK